MIVFEVRSFCGPQELGNSHLVCFGLGVSSERVSILCAPHIIVDLSFDAYGPRAEFFQFGKRILRCGSGYLAAAAILHQKAFSHERTKIARADIGHPHSCTGSENISLRTSWKTILLSQDTDGSLAKRHCQYSFKFPIENLPYVSNDTNVSRFVDAPVLYSFYIGGKHDYLALILGSEKAVQNCRVRLNILKKYCQRSLIISSVSSSSIFDCVVRYFAPRYSPHEDQATGSANAFLARYWQKRLNKRSVLVKQLSRDGGVLKVTRSGLNQKVSGQVSIEKQYSHNNIEKIIHELG
ncbi:MAG: PhzF family phenazine biosynthesis protein [Agarilytica sp.]